MVEDSRITAHESIVWKWEPREDCTGAKGRARLAATVVAVADVEGEWSGSRRLKADRTTLTAGFHDGYEGRGREEREEVEER